MERGFSLCVHKGKHSGFGCPKISSCRLNPCRNPLGRVDCGLQRNLAGSQLILLDQGAQTHPNNSAVCGTGFGGQGRGQQWCDDIQILVPLTWGLAEGCPSLQIPLGMCWGLLSHLPSRFGDIKGHSVSLGGVQGTPPALFLSWWAWQC